MLQSLPWLHYSVACCYLLLCLPAAANFHVVASQYVVTVAVELEVLHVFVSVETVVSTYVLLLASVIFPAGVKRRKLYYIDPDAKVPRQTLLAVMKRSQVFAYIHMCVQYNLHNPDTSLIFHVAS